MLNLTYNSWDCASLVFVNNSLYWSILQGSMTVNLFITKNTLDRGSDKDFYMYNIIQALSSIPNQKTLVWSTVM